MLKKQPVPLLALAGGAPTVSGMRWDEPICTAWSRLFSCMEVSASRAWMGPRS
jgi:hypothetical protein